MRMLATVFTAAAVLSLGMAAARADESGQLACQLSLAQFSDDVAAAKNRLRPGHLAAARQLVDVGYGQCNSGPNLVMSKISAMRQSLALSSGGHGVGTASFWPTKEQQLSELYE